MDADPGSQRQRLILSRNAEADAITHAAKLQRRLARPATFDPMIVPSGTAAFSPLALRNRQSDGALCSKSKCTSSEGSWLSRRLAARQLTKRDFSAASDKSCRSNNDANPVV